MNINTYKLYFQFFTGTLKINLPFSLITSIIIFSVWGYLIVYSFAFLYVSLGFIISIIIKESGFSNKDEYYFYYNFGISKIKLFIMCELMNLIFATVLITGYKYVERIISR